MKQEEYLHNCKRKKSIGHVNARVQPLVSVVTSFHSDQKVSGSIPGAAVEFFSSVRRIIPRYVRTVYFCVWVSFIHVVFGWGPCTLLTTDQWRFSNCVRVTVWGLQKEKLTQECKHMTLLIITPTPRVNINMNYKISSTGVTTLRLASHMRLFEGLFVALDKCTRVLFSFLCYYIF